jgi:hypothetical protein
MSELLIENRKEEFDLYSQSGDKGQISLRAERLGTAVWPWMWDQTCLARRKQLVHAGWLV